MWNPFRKKTSDGLSHKLTPNQEKEVETSRLNESQSMTLHRSFGEEQVEEGLSDISIEYHLTIQTKNSSLTPRDLSLLLEVLNYQAVHFGVNVVMQMAMYELYFRLLGNKRNSEEIRDRYIRKTVTVTEILFKILKNQIYSLNTETRIVLSAKHKDLLAPMCLSKRTYGSRFRTFRPEKFFTVRIVPVDIQFLTRRKDSSPYSSYCKGYGESHPSAHRQKLKPNSELDGEATSPSEFEKSNTLFVRCTDPVHLQCEALYIRFRNLEAEEN